MSNRIVLDITDRQSFAGGRGFGDSGAYERLRGRARIAVDPAAPAQAGIVDLDKAPVNGDGLVEFSTDVCILKPVDPAKGNRRLFFDYGNRGNMRMLQFFNDAAASNDPMTPGHAGNGFLFRRGYSVVWGAWQGDILPGDGRLCLDVPVARDGDAPITGLVRSEFIFENPGITCHPLSGRPATHSYPTVSRDTRRASLTRRRYPGDEREPVLPEAWSFAVVQTGTGLDGQGGERGIAPSDSHIYLPGGFEPGWIYELVYTARDPLVLGLGHVAVRDLVSFLRHADADDAGTANPLAAGGGIERAYAWGRSQTGRAIRDFIYRGFNADAAGRKVFDGMLPHVAGAGRMWMNHRFANVTSAAGQDWEAHHHYADSFPFAYAETTDPHSGRSDAILKRPDTDPLVLHTQTGTEYWQRRGSLVHTDPLGNDIDDHPMARIYLWSSSQHFADPNEERPATSSAFRSPSNIVRTSMLFRAMLDAMDRWASDGTAPPDSRVPRRADGTLVSVTEWRAAFPDIPGVLKPLRAAPLPLFDFGPDAGIFTTQPPRVIEADAYTVLVPQVDADGNDIAGVRAPMVAAPLATYTGWNVRARGYGNGALYWFTGSTLAFADTVAERHATGDPRPATAERYADVEAYKAAIEAAARALVADGLMLEEDVERAVAAAENWDRPRHDVDLPG